LQRLAVAIRLDFGKLVTDAARGNLSTRRAFTATVEPAERVGRDAQDFSGGTLEPPLNKQEKKAITDLKSMLNQSRT
jgi:hypothetical protein